MTPELAGEAAYILSQTTSYLPQPFQHSDVTPAEGIREPDKTGVRSRVGMGQVWEGTAIARFVTRFSPFRICTQHANLYRHDCIQKIFGFARNYVSCCWKLRRHPQGTVKQVAGFCGAQGTPLPRMHQCTNEGAPSTLRPTVRGTDEVFRVGCAVGRFILLSASQSHEVLSRSFAICEAYWGPLPRLKLFLE